MFRVLLMVALAVVALTQTTTLFGHTVFKKELQKKYSKTRVSCEACHVKGQPKTERNEFGELFFQKLKDQNMTKQWEAFGEDTAGKSKFEKETMLPAFIKVLDEIKVTTNKDKVTFDSLLSEAKLPGLKVKKAGAKSSDDDDDDDDEEENEKGKETANKNDKAKDKDK